MTLDRKTLLYIFDEVANMQIENVSAHRSEGVFTTSYAGGKHQAYDDVMTLINQELAKEKKQFINLIGFCTLCNTDNIVEECKEGCICPTCEIFGRKQSKAPWLKFHRDKMTR
jgi:hypothetical protein